jgi:hypothetical protein
MFMMVFADLQLGIAEKLTMIHLQIWILLTLNITLNIAGLKCSKILLELCALNGLPTLLNHVDGTDKLFINEQELALINVLVMNELKSKMILELLYLVSINLMSPLNVDILLMDAQLPSLINALPKIHAVKTSPKLESLLNSSARLNQVLFLNHEDLFVNQPLKLI